MCHKSLPSPLHPVPVLLLTTLKVFPAHGAGSPCGKNISKDLFSTIGKEKTTNVALSYENVRVLLPILSKLVHISVNLQ